MSSTALPGLGRVFRAEAVLAVPVGRLQGELFERLEEMPRWNPSLSRVEVGSRTPGGHWNPLKSHRTQCVCSAGAPPPRQGHAGDARGDSCQPSGMQGLHQHTALQQDTGSHLPGGHRCPPRAATRTAGLRQVTQAPQPAIL